MFRAILEQRAQEAELPLTPRQLDLLDLFAAELKKWNRRFNLTAITRDDDIAVKHILDSLFLIPHLGAAQSVLDIGSGAGLPAIPLKIARPELSVVSVDAVAKKIHFQRHVARLLQLQDFEALHERVELLPRSGRRFDLVTSRAFSDLGTFVTHAAPLLTAAGQIIAMKGPGAEEEAAAGRERLDALGFRVCSLLHYDLPCGSGSRCLVVIAGRGSSPGP